MQTVLVVWTTVREELSREDLAGEDLSKEVLSYLVETNQWLKNFRNSKCKILCDDLDVFYVK